MATDPLGGRLRVRERRRRLEEALSYAEHRVEECRARCPRTRRPRPIPLRELRDQAASFEADFSRPPASTTTNRGWGRPPGAAGPGSGRARPPPTPRDRALLLIGRRHGLTSHDAPAPSRAAAAAARAPAVPRAHDRGRRARRPGGGAVHAWRSSDEPPVLRPGSVARCGCSLVPPLVSLVTGVLLAKVFPDVRGSGVPQTEAAYHLHGGVIPARVPIGKFITGVLCIGSGHSMGREGPSVQIGAGLASVDRPVAAAAARAGARSWCRSAPRARWRRRSTRRWPPCCSRSKRSSAT